jgi:hypothetical protein
MRKLVLSIMAVVLIALPSLCGAADFQPLSPQMAAKIKAIRDEVRAKGGTYEVGYSAAMDKGIDRLCGLRIPAGWNKDDAPQVRMLSASEQTLPSSYDWRTLNGVTPIKNQGSCGDCWAFGTVGPLESQILLKDGVTVSLAEQYLVSCNVDGWSCNGGWWAHDYHLSKSGQDNNGPGAVLTSADPYTGTNSACNQTYSHPYKISNWAYVGSEMAVPSVDAIKQAIYTYGPISVAVYVGDAFQAYTGGIFNTTETGTPNHAVVLVGWNDDLGPDNGYWILRNSWGASWGESGYMRIRYNVSQVGYAANFIEYAGSTPTPTPTSVSVPSVVGDTQSVASTAITGEGLVVGTITTQSSSTVAAGLVISQNPASGTSVASGSAVSLVVSSGAAPPPPPTTVAVPSVVGDTQAAATTAITKDGLTVGTVTTQSSTTVASGVVIGQNPTAGTSVTTGSAVSLVVSSGAPPNPTPPPAANKPDLTGAFSSLSTSFAGKSLYGSFQVQNIGTAATSNSFRVLLYLSNDGVAKTTLLGSATISFSMPAGARTNLNIRENSTTSLIGKYVMCVVDPDDSVPESNFNNNVIVKQIP